LFKFILGIEYIEKGNKFTYSDIQKLNLLRPSIIYNNK